jgi:hypothetical protein
MSDIKNLQELAGIYKPVQESLQQHSYAFLIVDPATGEYTEYYRGSPIEIIKQLRDDPENSMIADLLAQKNFGSMDDVQGNLSFKHDDHLYMFVPL